MREILFRGQHRRYGEKVLVGTGERLPGRWVYGGVLQGTGDFSVIYGAESPDFRGSELAKWPVYTDTLGQYTGLNDKNGKRIFEGDKLLPFDDDIDKMVVEFDHGQFLVCIYGDRGYRSESGDWEYDGSNYGIIECEPLSSYGDDIMVIGNIHDNPELLKGG